MMLLPGSKKITLANKLLIQKEINFDFFFKKSMNSTSIKKLNIQKSMGILLNMGYISSKHIFLCWVLSI